MDKLNSDMVLETLNRLPIESVLQCRRVCAIWRNLLGKPKTAEKYYECAGFGYCHSTCAYKVVRSLYKGNGKHGVKVYTLGNGNGWEDKPEEISYAFTGTGVFANGAVHWLIDTTISKCDIVAFDLEDETFRCLPSPLFHFTCNSSINVTLEGDLSLCLPYIEQGEPMMDGWVFKKKNMNNCRLSTRLAECTYINSFTLDQGVQQKIGLCLKVPTIIPNRE
ncbi:uncharacterized protein LOC113332364 [Papaver somniferum]|uniref:uncharacterized protein LOC113332364 n=1 Tax=Papaver somniferum TaxID=3469 RepID=UPI000E703418|nr:uncharacterized protein LOC113332364 [Papaver somniferum]